MGTHERARIPWWGRLTTRIMVSLAALGTLCVGASAYLVDLTIDYFKTVDAAQADASLDTIAGLQPYYTRYVAAKRDTFAAKAELLALRLAHDAPADPEDWAHEAVAHDREIAWLEIRGIAFGSDAIRAGGSGLGQGRPEGDDELEPLRVIRGLPMGGEMEVAFHRDRASDLEFRRLGQRLRAISTASLGESVVERSALEDALRLGVLAASGGVLLVALLAGWALARTMTRQASDVAAVMRRVAAGEASARVLRTGQDEMGRLGEALNRMLNEVEATRSRVAYLERIAAWQEMARRLAHEIKNPLTPIRLAVQQLKEKDPGCDPGYSKLVRESAEIVEDEIDGLRRLVVSFSQFARLPAVELARIELRQVVDEFARAYGHLTECAQDRLEIELGERPLKIAGDRQLLKQALINLVENAVLSAQAHGLGDSAAESEALDSSASERRDIIVRIRLSIAVLDDSALPWARLEVLDNGPGVPEARRDRIFEPYETTRDDGTGLGLAIVKKIVLDHGGKIGVSDAPGGGACFWLVFPLLASETPPQH